MRSYEITNAVDSDIERIKRKVKQKGWVIDGDNCYHKECHIALMAEHKMSQDPDSDW